MNRSEEVYRVLRLPGRMLAVALCLAPVLLAGCSSSESDMAARTLTRTATASPGNPASSEPSSASRTPASSTSSAPKLPLAGRVVVLDPGHNRDNGRHPKETGRLVDAGGFTKQCNTTGTSTNSGVPESRINWEIALLVRDRLAGMGARVVLTRKSDAGWGPCIDERAHIANDADADLLLSLHADGAAASGRGFHVIAPGPRTGWTDDIPEDSATAATLVRDSLVAAGLDASDYLGQEGLDVRTDLGTLNRADVPAVMLEAGNLRNADDAALLTSRAGQARLADALARAVRVFLRR